MPFLLCVLHCGTLPLQEASCCKGFGALPSDCAFGRTLPCPVRGNAQGVLPVATMRPSPEAGAQRHWFAFSW